MTAFLAQGAEPLHAAALGCYLGGLAAELLAARLGIHGMTAPDLADAIPQAIVALTEK